MVGLTRRNDETTLRVDLFMKRRSAVRENDNINSNVRTQARVAAAMNLCDALLWVLAAFLVGTAIVWAITSIGRAQETQQAAPEVLRDRVVPQSRAVVQHSFAPIVREAAPAVVNVYVSSRVKTFASPFARDPIFRQFFGDRFGRPSERMQSSLGSGVIVSEEGVIVTNAHVIKLRGKTKIRVALSDKREFDARVIATDEKSDIAIIKIDNENEKFPFLEFENSDALEVGDLVLAIGNPFGVGQTVTSGIISGLARTGIGKSDSIFIQTDAAINPGNSGGALVDITGRLVGINTAIFSRSGGSNGIGFAIPSNLVRLYVDSAKSGRTVAKPWIGARLQPVNRDLAQALGLSRVAGALVERIYDESPAANAGLKPGDVIVSVDGFAVEDARAVLYRLTTKGVNNGSRLQIIRENQRREISLTPTATPELSRDDVRNLSGRHPFHGARVANLVPHVAEDMELDVSEGVVVLSVRRGSAASRIGLRKGDVIVKVGPTTIKELSNLEAAVSERQPYWAVALRRRGRIMRFRVRG